jgi:hypothetical protein
MEVVMDEEVDRLSRRNALKLIGTTVATVPAIAIPILGAKGAAALAWLPAYTTDGTVPQDPWADRETAATNVTSTTFTTRFTTTSTTPPYR